MTSCTDFLLSWQRFPELRTDVVALLDEWAARFFEELDYIHEGENATKFAEQIKADLPQVLAFILNCFSCLYFSLGTLYKGSLLCVPILGSTELECLKVVVPRTYSAYTSRRVLTSQWLDGEKLSQSTADDVGSLVNVGVILYLKQLLETGFFHADPHPGNLIRTPDGRLAVLDFGLMTQVCHSSHPFSVNLTILNTITKILFC